VAHFVSSKNLACGALFPENNLPPNHSVMHLILSTLMMVAFIITLGAIT